MVKIKREEIYNINGLTEKKEERVALIRTAVEKSFQTASVIVMRAVYPKYILKKN